MLGIGADPEAALDLALREQRREESCSKQEQCVVSSFMKDEISSDCFWRSVLGASIWSALSPDAMTDPWVIEG